MTGDALPWISADEVFARVSFGAAVRAVQRDLRAGPLRPSQDGAMRHVYAPLRSMPRSASKRTTCRLDSG